jgi:hypothetical protein
MDPGEPQRSNAFKLALEGSELVIEFGNAVPPAEAPGPASVAVSDRVILQIDTGRRLLFWLNDCLQSHAATLRVEEAKALPPAQAAVAARAGQAPERPPPDEAGERAARLLRMVGGLGVAHQYERSFRICRRALLANRFLLTVDPSRIPGDAAERVLQICDKLQIPPASREEAAANFTIAKAIHFGFEADEVSILGKLYLEREVPVAEAERARASGEPVLLHLAFKWDLAKQTAVTTRYWWRPSLSAAEITERLAHVYRDGPKTSFEVASATLALTQERVATERLQYLEVEEDENGRRSFDLNLYDARLQVKDMQPLLDRLREHFEVRPGQFQALYDQIKARPLGHLAGGVHRNGEDFFNIYYGVVGLPAGPRADNATPPLTQVAAAAQRSKPAPASSRSETGDRAAELARMIAALGVPHQYERSFKIGPGALLPDRFLLTVNARDIPHDPVERTLAICDHMHMPPAEREAAAAHFAMAKCVHFGSEDDGGVGKLYLERDVPADEVRRARAAGQPALLGIAFKWYVAKAAAVTARYLWYPELSASEIEERLEQVYRDRAPVLFDIARDLLALTKTRIATEHLRYLEVEEGATARRSYDLSFYGARLQVKDMQPLLWRMSEHFEVPASRLQALYDQVKLCPLGNFAGGVHRKGEDFFTMYYALGALPHFNRAFI